MFRTDLISIYIDRPFAPVYDFLVDPANLLRWMPSLGPVLRHVSGNEWVAENPHWPPGPLMLRFTPRNRYGVLDVVTTSARMGILTTPCRLVHNGLGCEIIYLLRQFTGLSDEAFASEQEWLRSDLLALKTLLEATLAAP
jgi:hypothetical protein